MTNYFELFDKRLSAIEANQQEILSRLAAGSSNTADEVGNIELAIRVTHLSKPRIYTLVSERAIPHSKRGNRLYFSRAELLKWITEGSRKSAEEGAVA